MSIKKLFRAFKLWHYKKANGVGSYLHDQYLTVLHFIYEAERVKLIKEKKGSLKSEDHQVKLREVLFRSTILLLLVWVGIQYDNVYQYLRWVIYPIFVALLSIPIYFLFEYLFENNTSKTDTSLLFRRIVFIKLFITGSFYNPPHEENKEPLYIKVLLYIAMLFAGITVMFLSILTNKGIKVLLYNFATFGLGNKKDKGQVLFEFTSEKKNNLEEIDKQLREFSLDKLGYRNGNKSKRKKDPYLKRKDYPKAKAIAQKIANNPQVSTRGEFWNRLYPAINKSKEIDNKKINSESTLRQYGPFVNFIKEVLIDIKK